MEMGTSAVHQDNSSNASKEKTTRWQRKCIQLEKLLILSHSNSLSMVLTPLYIKQMSFADFQN